ncbi:MAG TPA: hypothetical protein VMS17_04615 [Gemmataceae bacterium]|nr:hypothetical protein [Gemmataceae bacterium]
MSESSSNDSPEQARPINPGGRDVPADDPPLPAGPATVPMLASLRRGPDRLVLRAPFWPMIPAVLGIGSLSAYWFLSGAMPFNPTAVTFVLLFFGPGWACCGWICYRCLVRRVTFDTKAGLLTLGWRGRRGRRPLSSIIGVQAMMTRVRSGGSIAAMPQAQMNLILDDPAERRLNVMTGPLAWSLAQKVADFLGVPVLRPAAMAAAIGAAAAAREAQTTAMPKDAKTVAATWPVVAAVARVAPIPSPVVSEPRPGLLVIRQRFLAPPLGFPWKALAPILLALMWGALVFLIATGHAADWYTIAVIPLAPFALLIPLSLVLYRRARFDRTRGKLTVGWRGARTAPWPLESVKAVEVMGGSRSNLCLLLDDSKQRRLFLITDADAALVRRAAERLASFLGVPLQVATQPTLAAQSGTRAEAVNPLELLKRSALSPGRATIRGPTRLVPKREDVLVLRPRWRLTWAWLRLAPAVFAFGLELSILWLAWFGPAVGQARLASSALIVLLFGALAQVAALRPMLLYRDRFDRRTGLLTLGWSGFKGKHPLEKVLAVQLIPGGLVERSPLSSFWGGEHHVSYQLNLVIADAREDRLNLTDDTDLEWTRQAGQQIADFLDVPLIDQIADGD